MERIVYRFIILAFIASLAFPANAEEPSAVQKGPTKPSITISEDMDDAIVQEASRVKEDLKQQARSLFERQPLGWNWKTISYLSQWLIFLPQQLPAFSKQLVIHSRALGVAGSFLIFVFLAAVAYSLLGRRRVLAMVENRVKTLAERLPDSVYPYFRSLMHVMVTPLIPLILLGAFSLIRALIDYDAAWFLFTGRLLWLWVLSALSIAILREILTRNLFDSMTEYGHSVFHITRLIILSIFVGLAIFWGAEAFEIRADVLEFLKFVISITLVFISFLLVLKKKALLSLIPELPYNIYHRFTNWFEKYYYPLIV
ncbi:MAG: hypothetical protein PVI62_06425, partial [Desulfobacterales bacterium]